MSEANICCFQEEEAGKVKEAEGDVDGAITLFLKGGLPGHAADCVNNHPSYPFSVRPQPSLQLYFKLGT